MENAELRKANASHETRPASFSILNSQFPIAFVLTLFIALCAINNILFPVFEASDEASHFRFADYLPSERRWPDLKRDLPSHEVTQPVLYYALVALAISPFDRSGLDDISHLNPDWFDQTLNADYKSVYPLHLHTPQENWPWSITVWSVHTGRLVSTRVGPLTVLFVSAIAA